MPATLSGGERLQATLDALAQRVGSPHALRVGFLEGATYPDGTSVPMVAAIQEFGAPRVGIPPRPFFRTMIAARSPEWGPLIAGQLKATDYDAETTLGRAGEVIAGELGDSIIELTQPPLSEVTLWLRKLVPQDRKATWADLQHARALVKGGKFSGLSGSAAKPLVHTGHLLNSIGYEVDGQRHSAHRTS